MPLAPFIIKFPLTDLSNLYNFPEVIQAILFLASPYIILSPGAAINEIALEKSSNFLECESA